MVNQMQHRNKVHGLTYARRYSVLMAFGLATTDDDGASLDKEIKITPKMESALRDLIADKNISAEEVKAVLEKHNYKTLKDINMNEVVTIRNELAKDRG